MKQLHKALTLFAVGGSVYGWIECVWRGRTHWTMIVLGGILFLLLGGINEFLPWEMPLVHQCIIGAAMVTVAELLVGLLVNVALGMNVWDYSDVPFNLMGQICLPYSVLWIFLSGVGIFLDDYVRYVLFKEEKPHYVLL